MSRTWRPSFEEYDQCNRKARRDGMFAGATGGLFAALFGERMLGFNPQKMLMSGILAGALSGYLFSQAFLSTYLYQLEGDAFRRAQLQTKHDLQTEVMHGIPNQTSKENE